MLSTIAALAAIAAAFGIYSLLNTVASIEKRLERLPDLLEALEVLVQESEKQTTVLRELSNQGFQGIIERLDDNHQALRQIDHTLGEIEFHLREHPPTELWKPPQDQ